MKEQRMTEQEGRAGWRISAWAKATGVSRATAYRLIDRGDLPAAKGGTSRIILESPQDFLERHAGAELTPQ